MQLFRFGQVADTHIRGFNLVSGSVRPAGPTAPFADGPFAGRLELEQVGVFEHSFGGATAVETFLLKLTR